MEILKNIVVGYEEYEDILLSNIAMAKNIVIIGKHGVGKTTIAKAIGKGFKNELRIQYYDCTKANMVTVCGIPNAERMKEGKFEFVPHGNTIWNKDIIILDELTRANKENQSMWMELLEDGTLYGIPVNHKCIIATCNPQTYVATYKMDEAVWDRFDSVIIAPDFQQINSLQIEEMLYLNISYQRKNRMEQTHQHMQKIFDHIEEKYNELRSNKEIKDLLIKYVSKLVEILLIQEKKTFISPRVFSRQLPEQILILTAYYKCLGEKKPLVIAAKKALIGTVINKLKLDCGKVLTLHENLQKMLENAAFSKNEKYLVKYSCCQTVEQKVDYWEREGESLSRSLKPDEFETLAGEIYQNILESKEEHYLVPFETVLSKCKGADELKRQVEGQIVFLMNKRITEIKCLSGTLTISSVKDDKLVELMNRLESLEISMSKDRIRRLLNTNLEEKEVVDSFISKLNYIIEGKNE